VAGALWGKRGNAVNFFWGVMGKLRMPITRLVAIYQPIMVPPWPSLPITVKLLAVRVTPALPATARMAVWVPSVTVSLPDLKLRMKWRRVALAGWIPP